MVNKEENKKRWALELEKKDKGLDKKNIKSTKLDIKTFLFLFIIHVKVVKHPLVEKVETKKTMHVSNINKNEAYVFESYDEYKNYFLMYLKSVDEELINLIILTRGSKGQIVALKGLCKQIIIKQKANEVYESLTQEKIDEIHSKGNITPMEKVEEWKQDNVCAPALTGLIEKCRCDFFGEDCNKCLREYASHNLEYKPSIIDVSSRKDMTVTYPKSKNIETPNMDFMKNATVVKENYTEEYKQLQEEADRRIEEDRRRQKDALKSINDCVALSSEQESAKKLILTRNQSNLKH